MADFAIFFENTKNSSTEYQAENTKSIIIIDVS